MRKQPKECTEPVGGIAFYASLLVFVIIGLANCVLLTPIVFTSSIMRWLVFTAGMISGGVFAASFINGGLSVFLHELKHSIISNLAGNRAKQMKVGQRSGYFRFEFTKETAHLNAFIALAPYCVPIFTVLGALFISVMPIVVSSNDPRLQLLTLGFCYGIDLVINARDISPYQTDFSMLRGGFGMGLLYTLACNFTFLTVIAAWVAGGPLGLIALGKSIWSLVLGLSHLLLGKS